MKNTQVVVLGMHRSGTSLLALVLKELGVNMGDETLEGSSSNPYGHEEDLDFLSLNRKILKSSGGSWDFPPNEKAIEKKAVAYENEIQEVVRKRNSRNALWGWKEPRTTLLANFYKGYLSNPMYVCMYRNKNDVANSLNKRNKMPINKGTRLTDEYNKRMENFLLSVDDERVLKITFEDITSNPKVVVEELLKFLSIDANSVQIENAVKVIRPLKVVRNKGSELKKNEFREKLIKAIKNPVKAATVSYKRNISIIRYYMENNK